MRITRRFNTIFHRLVFSYAILIIATAIFMGMVSYGYFTKHFDREIERTHRLMLENTSAGLKKQLFDPMIKLYAELSSNTLNQKHVLLFFRHPVQSHNADIWSAYQYLQHLTAASDGLIESIDVYYRDNRMMISSSQGYRTFQTAERWRELEWLDDNGSGEAGNFTWLDLAPDFITHADGRPTITLVVSYPYLHGESNLGYVVIHANPAAAASLLPAPTQQEASSLFILSPGAYFAEGELQMPLPVLEDLRADGKANGHQVENVNGVPYMMTYTELEIPSWKLVSAAPIDQFYQKSGGIWQTLLAIGLTSIGLGIAISLIFTNRIYHPLRTLMERTKDLFREGGASGKPGNEYVQINDLIDNLSVKVTQLELTINANLPLVKQSLVANLLTNRMNNKEKLNDYLKLMGVRHVPVHCIAVAFQFDERMIDRLTLENGQFFIYHFMDQLESGNSKELFGFSASFSESGVGAVFFADEPDTPLLQKRIEYVQSHSYANFMIRAFASAGEWVRDPACAWQSYQEALDYLEYRFLFPDNLFFIGEAWKQRSAGGDALDGGWLPQWTRALKSSDLPAAARLLQEWRTRLQDGRFSALYAKQAAQDAVHAYRQYLLEVHLELEELFADEPAHYHPQGSTIDEWEAWLMKAAARAFALLKERTENRSSQTIDKVKDYIRTHLSIDLSLNAVSDQVSLNPSYLSRMFKTLTGVNYVDYVTMERMSRARELLLTTDENIESIAQLVGYFNPAYFTKKFKEAYGMTPSEFRYQQQS